MKKKVNKETNEQAGNRNSYWPLVLPVLFIAIASIGVYVWNFWGLPPSRKPSDWAAFATYVSGTVGVAAVVATLIAFIFTLRQQQKLIDSQDDIINQQDKEFRKKEAYDIAIIIFPKVKERVKALLNTELEVFLRKEGFALPDKWGHGYQAGFVDILFTDYEVNIGFETFLDVFNDPMNNGGGGVRAARFLQVVKHALKIVESCVKDYPELGSYLYDESLQKTFGCLLAYERGCTGGESEEFKAKCGAAGLCPKVGDSYGIEKMWYDLGLSVSKPVN